jgi:hypothetical protein
LNIISSPFATDYLDSRFSILDSQFQAAFKSRIANRELRISDQHTEFAGQVAHSGKPLIVNNVGGDQNFNNSIDETTGFVTKSLICIPLMTHNKTLGVIEVLNKLDQELERRGHRYGRWADDFIILVKSERAGTRVMESITQYLEGGLGLNAVWRLREALSRRPVGGPGSPPAARALLEPLHRGGRPSSRNSNGAWLRSAANCASRSRYNSEGATQPDTFRLDRPVLKVPSSIRTLPSASRPRSAALFQFDSEGSAPAPEILASREDGGSAFDVPLRRLHEYPSRPRAP